MNRGRLVTLIATACAALTASPALAAGVSAPCTLPGYMAGAGARPCPATGAGAPAESPQFLGIHFDPISSLAKGVLDKVVGWVDSSAAAALRYTETLIAATTRPAVTSTWFSATYWRVAALSTLLTLPFLFAASIHALVRADLAMAARAAFAYLPLAMIAITIAAPLTALVLGATDEMSSFVSGASGSADATFLGHAATSIGGLSLVSGDAFLAFFAGVLTVAATVSLWIELIIRAAAVEVIVLMLPLFFAAMVWPARRVWAIRAIETLIALILSKFAIVAVLTLGAAAVTQPSAGPTALLTGATLVLLAVFSPWALLRVLPLHEVAAAAAGGLSSPPRDALRAAKDLATGAPRRGSGGDGSGDLDGGGPPDGGGPEAAVRRLAAFARPARGAERSAAEPAFDAGTQAGLVAIDSQGSPSDPPAARPESSVSPGTTAPSASEPSVTGGDGRPPLPPQFAPGSRPDVYTLGVRLPPRFDGRAAESDTATPAVTAPSTPDVGGAATESAAQAPPADVASPADIAAPTDRAVPNGLNSPSVDPPPPAVISPPMAGEVHDPSAPAGGQADE